MNLLSKDIKKRDFKKSLRGYDASEVDAFLDTVSTHYDRLLIENRNLNERIKALLSDIDIYKDNEINLQKALIKSQDLGEEIITNAKKKAELILKEAEINSKNMKHNIDNDIINKKQELEEVKTKNERMLEEVKNYLIEKLNELEDFIKNKKIFKMELTSLSRVDTDIDIQEEKGTEEDKPKRKFTINPNSQDRPNPTFDDNFELK